MQGSTKACSNSSLQTLGPYTATLKITATNFACPANCSQHRNLQTSNRTTVWEAHDIKYMKGKPWDYKKELSMFSTEWVLLKGLFKHHLLVSPASIALSKSTDIKSLRRWSLLRNRRAEQDLPLWSVVLALPLRTEALQRSFGVSFVIWWACLWHMKPREQSRMTEAGR